MDISHIELAKYIDHTNVKPNATIRDIQKLCREALRFKFHSVCVTSLRVELAKKELRGSGIKIVVVVGFPHGSCLSEIKATETREAIKRGADEIDMVINIGGLKDKNYKLVTQDIKAVVQAAGENPVKVIIEVGYLSKPEIIKACRLAKVAGAAFIKTSTGFGPRGVDIKDIKLMRFAVGSNMGIKASGGILDQKKASSMIRAGADRIGTSAGVEIILNKKTKKNPIRDSAKTILIKAY